MTGNGSQTSYNIKNAARLGYKALVLTADYPVIGKRRPHARRPFGLPSHLTCSMFSIVSRF